MALTRIGSVGLSTGIDINAGVGTFTGDLTVGGVLTYEDVTNVDSIGLITARNGIVVGSGITLSKDGDIFFTGIMTGNGSGLTGVANTDVIFTDKLSIGDGTQTGGDQINIGIGSDLTLYHSGSHSFIDRKAGGTGDIYVRLGTDNALIAKTDGAVELYHDNSKKLETASGGVTVTGSVNATSFTGDGTNLTITSSNTTTIDSTNSIFLKSAQSTHFRKGSTNYLTISDSSSDAVITSAVQDKDIIFKGDDNGSAITALTLDMSEGGAAIFNDNITLSGNKKVIFGTADENINGDGSNVLNINSGGAINLAGNSTNITSASTNIANFSSQGSKLFVMTNSSQSVILETDVSDKDLIFRGNDGGSVITALTLDMSEAGAATFNSTVESTGNFVTGAPTLGNDEATFGFTAPNAELKVQNSSGSPAANFDIHTTNSSGTTARVFRATHDGNIQLMSGDTVVGKLSNSSSDFVIENDIQD